MSCWTVLRITPTRNIYKINEAYVELSNSISENNKDAEELELAYNKAISLATASIGDLNIALLNNSNFDILSALINSISNFWLIEGSFKIGNVSKLIQESLVNLKLGLV